MFTATLNRLAISLPKVFRFRATKRSERRGPLPTWIKDRQLSEQLLRDTGLTPEDLGVHKAYDAKKAFFLQQDYW